MKKLLYIIPFMMLAMACNHEIIEPEVSPDDNKAVLDFSVQLPDMTPATKAMAEEPSLRSLHLAVFDEAGYLSEYVLASPVELAQTNGTRYSYTANLSLSANPRIIHFIGNGPATVRFGTEEAVMSSIKSSGSEDLYWYRTGVPYIAGVQQGLDTPMQIDEATRIYLSNIPLIRNFAKVVLVDESPEFTLKSYAVVNSLSDGMLSAYNADSGSFVDYFTVSATSDANGNVTALEYTPKTFATLRNSGYDANIPASSSFISLEEAWNGAVGSGVPCFVYERETPDTNPTYIIAYGTYQGTDYYYKIDLRDNNGAYFPLLRNFEYTLTLKNVSRVGYETMEEAASSAGSGDISTALETVSLVYISDGVASLEVEYTEKVVLTTDPVKLHYTFLTDVSDDDSYGAASNIRVVVNDDAGLSGAAIASVNGNASFTPGETVINVASNPGDLTIVTTEPGSVPKNQSLTIYADYSQTVNGVEIVKTLQRTVRYVVMTKRTMTAVCIPSEVPKERGSEFAVQVTIPGGLSRGMFPLEFKIEARNLTITPNTYLDNMPVESGVSLSGSGSAFYFLKTLEWKDYDPLAPSTSFLCHFKTNADISASDIYVANPYFETAQTYLGNFDPKYFRNLEYSAESILIGEGVPFTFSFDMTELPSQGNVTVTLQGAEPDPDYDGQLTFIGINDAGKAQYSYTIPNNAGLTDHTLNLVTSSFGDQVTVTLDGHHFVQNSAICPRDGVDFTGLALSPSPVLVGVGQTTTFTFTYDAQAVGVPVTMTLTGLQPQAGDGRFTDKGNGVYVFQPESGTQSTSRTQTVTLVTATFGTRLGVSIIAMDYGYVNDQSVTASRYFVIKHGAHANSISNNTSAYVRIYESHPGDNWSNDYLVQTRMNSTGVIEYDNAWNDTVVLTKDVMENDVLYLQYYTTSYIFFRTYYVAEVTIDTLFNGGSITWVEQ